MRPIKIMQRQMPARVYATLDPAHKHGAIDLSVGNLRATRNNSAGAGYYAVRANMAAPSVPFYMEFTNVNIALGQTGYFELCGVSNIDPATTGGSINAVTPALAILLYSVAYVSTYVNGGAATDWTGYGGAVGPGGVVGWAIDRAAGKAWVRTSTGSGWINGGNPAAGTSPTMTFTPGNSFWPALSMYEVGTIMDANFGASAFAMTAPSGFQEGVYT